MMNNMVQDTKEEKAFRERYAHALRLMKSKEFANPHFGSDELIDERNRVKKQALMTPGRRGEQIKHEEIDKEICRRYALANEGRKVTVNDK
jgi:hypothetical protein